jgi:hypothetical protein
MRAVSLFATALVIAASDSASGQLRPAALSRETIADRSDSARQVVAAQAQLLREMSPWIGWGGVVGFGGGVLYAVTKDYGTETGGLASMAVPFVIIIDVLAGFVIGMAGGLVAFVISKVF